MSTVLLLNASFEPLTVIHYRRAISLWARGRVDAATADTLPIHGVNDVFHLPSVVRLRRYVVLPRYGVRWSRKGVLNRDGYRCVYCGVRSGEKKDGRTLNRYDLTVDHILPRSRGGPDSWLNTACACWVCNQAKDNRTPAEAGLTLLWEPHTPKVNRLYRPDAAPVAWQIYLD